MLVILTGTLAGAPCLKMSIIKRAARPAASDALAPRQNVATKRSHCSKPVASAILTRVITVLSRWWWCFIFKPGEFPSS